MTLYFRTSKQISFKIGRKVKLILCAPEVYEYPSNITTAPRVSEKSKKRLKSLNSSSNSLKLKVPWKRRVILKILR